MDLSHATWAEPQVAVETEELPLTIEKLWYLWPSRYFHLYMFYEKKTGSTCWLPEGYMQ